MSTAPARAALEETAAALAAADLDRLLRAEFTLQLALDQLTARPPLAPDARHSLRREIDGTRRAVLRYQ